MTRRHQPRREIMPPCHSRPADTSDGEKDCCAGAYLSSPLRAEVRVGSVVAQPEADLCYTASPVRRETQHRREERCPVRRTGPRGQEDNNAHNNKKLQQHSS